LKSQYNRIRSQGTRSKVSLSTKSSLTESRKDDYDDDDQPTRSSSPVLATFKSGNQPASNLKDSVIIQHSFGYLYPIPHSVRSPEISTYQTGLQSLSTRTFNNAADISLWFEEFLAQALLINMHEFFAGQITFLLHPTCDALYHINNSSIPFQMKNVEENIAFLEYTSPTIITEPSQLPFFSEHKTTVYVTKKQLEVVQYVTKCTGQFLKSLMNIPGNTSYLRLITINFKIDVDQAVSMLESIYKYAVTNQKGRDIPLLIIPCTFEAGVH